MAEAPARAATPATARSANHAENPAGKITRFDYDAAGQLEMLAHLTSTGSTIYNGNGVVRIRRFVLRSARSLLFCNAVQKLAAAEEELVSGQGGRGVNPLVQHILGEQF